jgi:branched-chain amino acid transport system permease protein
MQTRSVWKLVAFLVVFGFVLAFPYLGASSYMVSLGQTILTAAMLAAALNFLIGNAGMPSLGHGAIAAASSYAVAWGSQQGFGAGTQVLLALGITVIVSLVYGVLSMRTSGIYFLMVTLALGMVIWGLAYRWSSVTGGENGITGVDAPEAIKPYWIYYYVVLAVFLIMTALLWVASNSPFGASLRGIRDSESRMRSLGYNVSAYKVGAFMISGFVSGTAGLFAVWHTHFVSPTSAGIGRSVLLIVMVILGGVGTVWGPLVGAAIVVLVENVLSTSVERWPTMLGLIFIFVILFARAGIVGSLEKVLRRRKSSGPPSPPSNRGSTDAVAPVGNHKE